MRDTWSDGLKKKQRCSDVRQRTRCYSLRSVTEVFISEVINNYYLSFQRHCLDTFSPGGFTVCTASAAFKKKSLALLLKNQSLCLELIISTSAQGSYQNLHTLLKINRCHCAQFSINSIRLLSFSSWWNTKKGIFEVLPLIFSIEESENLFPHCFADWFNTLACLNLTFKKTGTLSLSLSHTHTIQDTTEASEMSQQQRTQQWIQQQRLQKCPNFNKGVLDSTTNLWQFSQWPPVRDSLSPRLPTILCHGKFDQTFLKMANYHWSKTTLHSIYYMGIVSIMTTG